MISQIKDLMQIKELIDEIKTSVETHTSTVNSLKKDVSSLTKSLDEVKARQDEFLSAFSNNLDVIKDSKENLQKEVFDFKLLKAQLQKNILDKFEQELSSELKMYSEQLKTDIGEYNKLKGNVSSIVASTEDISSELTKFNEISKSIKKEDFELTQFTNQVQSMDKEKLALMRRIDSLERLVSKLRRR